MSMVETEETGARSVPAPPSVDYGAGVPFKKRRFPFIRPPSPPLLREESYDAKQTELIPPSDGSILSKSSVASEHPLSSVEKEMSFSLESSKNINLSEVDRVQSDNQDMVDGKNTVDKQFSPIQKRAESSEGCELSPWSNAPIVDQKDKPEDMTNLVLSDRNQGNTELMLVPSGSRESEAIQRSNVHHNLEGSRISTELTLAGPVRWHQGSVPGLSLNSSLSGRESDHCLAGADRSNWDLNATMNEPGDSAPVFSYGTAPCGDLISADRENDRKDAGRNLHAVEHKVVPGRTSSSYDYKEHHPGRCLDLGLRPSIPCSNPSRESPPMSAIRSPVLHLSTAVKLNNKKGISSPGWVKKEPADEPVHFCDRQTEDRTGKCGSISSLSFGTHLGDSRSIKVEPDGTSQQMNMSNENSCRQQEMSDFSELLTKEAEAMQINGPLGVESCPSMLASSGGCSVEHLTENDNPTGQSSHQPERHAANVSADSTVTNVAADGSEGQTSRLTIMVRAENYKKQDDDMVELMLQEDRPSAAKDIVKDNAEDSACNGEKIEISGCEDSNSCVSNNKSVRVPSVPADHTEISDQEDDYEDGEVREQLAFGVSQAGRGTSSPALLSCKEANVDLQLTTAESLNHVNGCSDATATCTPNVDEDQSQSRELSLKERVSSNPDCSFDLGELLDGNSTKHIREEMGQPCQSSVVNAPSVTQPGVDERVQTDRAINIEGKEDGNLLPETEVLMNSEVTSEDANVDGSNRRIITLPSVSSVSSPGKAKLITNRTLQMQNVRKRLPDMALEVDKPHLRGRNSARVDEFDELSSGRNQYSVCRNFRSKFSRDRGIVSNSSIRYRDVQREFSPELYYYPAERYPTRCSHVSEYRNSNFASEGRVSGDGCWGRRRLNGDGPYFRRQSSTRRSPGRRDGAPAHAIPTLDHVPRDISPVRCIGMDGNDMVSLRSNSKFRRDLGDNDLNSIFACSRMSCDDDVGGIARVGRKFHSFKNGRVLVRSRSNSPVMRSRSPIQRSSRRRSPEGFGGHLELSCRRAPAVYRENRTRLRSPDRGCFHGKIMRRQNPHLSQNSPGRGTFGIRRYSGVNTRDGPCDEYSKARTRTLWSKDISRLGESDERGLNEDRGLGRFPSPYSESDGSDMYSTDEAAAPYQLCPEDRPMYCERGHSRVKQVDRTENRSGHGQKSQKIEDREGSYNRRRRLCEEFDDNHSKRKRFRDPGLQ